jgi:hypothetical protein
MRPLFALFVGLAPATARSLTDAETAALAGRVGVLRQVYPQFAGVEFPADTITALEE